MDSLLGGDCLEGGEVSPIEDELRDELFEVLMQVLVSLFDVLEVSEDAFAHRSFKLYHDPTKGE